MKPTNLSLLLFMLSMILFSCSKDDEASDVANSGTMSYLGEEYTLNDARITDNGNENGVYNYTVTLYATDVKWNNQTFSKGHFVTFELNCNNPNGISAGTYTESMTDDFINMKSGSTTFFSISNEYPYSSYATIHPESIVVKINGSIYEITYKGTDGVDRDFSAKYKGALKKVQ